MVWYYSRVQHNKSKYGISHERETITCAIIIVDQGAWPYVTCGYGFLQDYILGNWGGRTCTDRK